MANAIYPTYLELILGSGLNLTSVNVALILVDLADYTYSAAHDFVDDVPAGARVATSGNLASKTVTTGTFDAADPTFSTVSGDESEAIICAENGGTPATDSVIAFYDTGITNIPVTPNGGDIDVTLNASGLFSL